MQRKRGRRARRSLGASWPPRAAFLGRDGGEVAGVDTASFVRRASLRAICGAEITKPARLRNNSAAMPVTTPCTPVRYPTPPTWSTCSKSFSPSVNPAWAHSSTASPSPTNSDRHRGETAVTTGRRTPTGKLYHTIKCRSIWDFSPKLFPSRPWERSNTPCHSCA